MLTLALFVALAVAVTGWLLREKASLLGKGMMVVGAVVSFGIVGWRFMETVGPSAGAGPDRGQAVVSYFLANQAMGELASRQGTVVMFFPPESIMDEEAVGTFAGTFGRVLRGLPGIKLEVVTLEVPDKVAKTGQIPLAAFQSAAAKHSGVIACVSFAGVPADVGDFKVAASERQPLFFVFDPWGSTQWLEPLKKGMVRAVVVPRPGVRHNAGDEISGEPGAVFSQLYLMATPANAAQIAGQLGAQ